MEAGERATRLTEAAGEYAALVRPAYDEVVEQVVARAEAAGDLGKVDLAALTAWKRLRADTPWMARLMGTADEEVRRHTRRALASARDERLSVPEAARAARSALTPLPGFVHGDALASAVCFAAAPHRLAVYDRRAHRALGRIGLLLGGRPGRYGRYLELIEQCRRELADHGSIWSAREVDQALYQIGRE